ncbi:MAG: TatD family hydrolase [Planctomycetes bacterium]|nr:TatD family hydrolase [Planctomycetota bacterium]
MNYIDPHVHMGSRTTDDYAAMKAAGVVAVIEPAFWMGQPRNSAASFIDAFAALVGWERFRASQFGIHHYCAIGLNAKEANNLELAEEVLELVSSFALKEGVVAIGEIGFDDHSPAEEAAYRTQIDIALELNLPVVVHTPHRDKKRGTLRLMDIAREHGLPPESTIIDHNNEETVDEVLARGYWTAFTIYPNTKMSSARMAAVVTRYGSERIIVDSSADWGVSDPLAVPKTARVMLEKGLGEEAVRKTCYDNALKAFSPSGQFSESDWLKEPGVDQREDFEGNSVLRGQNPLVDLK